MRALLLAALLTLLTGCVAGRSSEVSALTYNVRYGTADDGLNSWPLRRETALDVVRRRAPDVVGMQEVLDFQLAAFLEACPAYDAAESGGREADRSGEACPILFDRARLRRVDGGTFWLSATPEVAGSRGWDAALPRICTWVLFEQPQGGRFYVYNTHFDHRGARARLESARLLASRVAARDPLHPALVLGDLNTGEGSEPLAELSDLRDTFRVLYPDATEVGTFNGFRGGSDGAKIDYVFATPGVEVLAAEIVHDGEGARLPSDHYPVAARVRFRGAR